MFELYRPQITMAVLGLVMLASLVFSPMRQRQTAPLVWWGLLIIAVVMGPLVTGLLDGKLSGMARHLFGAVLVVMITLAAARLDIMTAWRFHRRACLGAVGVVLVGGGVTGMVLSLALPELTMAGALVLGLVLMLVWPATLSNALSAQDRQSLNILHAVGPLLVLAGVLLALIITASTNVMAQLSRATGETSGGFDTLALLSVLGAEAALGCIIGFALSVLMGQVTWARDTGGMVQRILILFAGVVLAMGMARLVGGGGWLAAGLVALVAGALSRPLGHAALAVEEALGPMPAHLAVFALGVGLPPVLMAMVNRDGWQPLALAMLLGLALTLLLRPASLLFMRMGLGVLPMAVSAPVSPVALVIIMMMVLSPGSPGEELLAAGERVAIIVSALVMAVTSWLASLASPLLLPLLTRDSTTVAELAMPGIRYKDQKGKQVVETTTPAAPLKAPASRNPAARARAGGTGGGASGAKPSSRNPQAARPKPKSPSAEARPTAKGGKG
ncbi:MAG: hypothetical protein Alpg2KO_25400 [Alphaproteobacteria bacterium]